MVKYGEINPKIKSIWLCWNPIKKKSNFIIRSKPKKGMTQLYIFCKIFQLSRKSNFLYKKNCHPRSNSVLYICVYLKAFRHHHISLIFHFPISLSYLHSYFIFLLLGFIVFYFLLKLLFFHIFDNLEINVLTNKSFFRISLNRPSK